MPDGVEIMRLNALRASEIVIESRMLTGGHMIDPFWRKARGIVILMLAAFLGLRWAWAADGLCDLPQGLGVQIAKNYPGLRPVNLTDLTKDDTAHFQKDHGNQCPGFVDVDFYGDGKPTVAVFLIPNKKVQSEGDLVVAHQVQGKWLFKRLENNFGPGVVWSEPPGDYSDVYHEKKITAKNPVIVLNNYVSVAILYAWTGKQADKIWLSD
jgi:hypothetical protein